MSFLSVSYVFDLEVLMMKNSACFQTGAYVECFVAFRMRKCRYIYSLTSYTVYAYHHVYRSHSW